MDDRKRKEVKQLQSDMQAGGVSRREFVTRLKGLGLGFGAAFMLGLREANALAPKALEAGLDVKSSNPAVDRIIGEAQEARDASVAQTRLAYSRLYPRYTRYARYARYTRYNRIYSRIYGRVLPGGGGPGPERTY